MDKKSGNTLTTVFIMDESDPVKLFYYFTKLDTGEI